MRTAAVLAMSALILVWSGGARAASPASVARATCRGTLEPWFSPEGNGYAGGAVYVVEFSNIGKSTCTVKGYPTAELTENGRQVGRKSGHDSLIAVKTVKLKPGATAHAVLTISDAGAMLRTPPANQRAIHPATWQHPPEELFACGFRGMPRQVKSSR